MVTTFSEAKCETWSMTSESADLVISGVDCLRLALAQECWDLALQKEEQPEGWQVTLCAGASAEQKRPKAGLGAFIGPLHTLHPQLPG